MQSRVVLALVQLVVGWFGALYLVRYIPSLGGLELFVYAVIVAVIVWIVGLVLSQMLRDLQKPSSAVLVSALVGALLGAALIVALPSVAPDFFWLLPRVPPLAYPLMGATLGYLVR
jgi:hypothetical protein